MRKFGQILIYRKKATEGFTANAGLFVCLSHSFWQSKQYPFSMFTLTNHTWAGNTNNNNVAICCTFNIITGAQKMYSNLGFSNFNLWHQLKKKWENGRTHRKGTLFQRRANGENLWWRRRPKTKHHSMHWRCSFVEAHEMDSRDPLGRFHTSQSRKTRSLKNNRPNRHFVQFQNFFCSSIFCLLELVPGVSGSVVFWKYYYWAEAIVVPA